MPTTYQFASLRRDLQVKVEDATTEVVANRMIETKPAKYVKFRDGFYRTQSEKEAEFIRDRIKNGLDAWELGKGARDKPEGELLSLVLDAVQEENPDAIRAILKREREGSGRETVIDACVKSLQRMGKSENPPGRPRKTD